jgi:hypothetical protein
LADRDTAIITAAFTLTGTIITALLGGSLFDRFFFPIVEIAVEEEKKNINLESEYHQVTITVTNYGSAPAENLTLFISSPSNFTMITNQFSTVDVKMTQLGGRLLEVKKPVNLTSAMNNSNYLELYIEKFNHGTGSEVVLNLQAEDLKLDKDNFKASAIYDNGSVNWVVARSFTFKGFVDNITNPGYVVWIALLSAIVGFFLYMIWPRLTKKLKEWRTTGRM